MQPNAVIVRAIRDKRRLRFVYNGRVRIVEPQCYGIGTKGTELLRAHQVGHGLLPAALFDVAKAGALSMIDDAFEKPGPGYRRDDSAMTTIFAQL